MGDLADVMGSEVVDVARRGDERGSWHLWGHRLRLCSKAVVWLVFLRLFFIKLEK